MTAKAKRFTSWSFSRWSDYELCPAKARYKHLDKLPEPASPALERGRAIHALAEDYIKGKLAKLPAELVRFKDDFGYLKGRYERKKGGVMAVEDTWAFTKDWGQTAWDDWARCWVRIKLDCAHEDRKGVLVVTDWKTGKFRGDSNEAYMRQLGLYALGAFLWYPHVTHVVPRLVYLDQGLVYHSEENVTYSRGEVKALKEAWGERVGPMLADTAFAPRPNWSCKFCHYRKDNGGPCKF